MKLLLTILALLSLLLAGCTASESSYAILAGTTDNNTQVIIRGATSNTTTQIIRADSATGAIADIDIEHWKIHDGYTFTILQVVDLGNSANRTLLIVTPDTTEWAHLVWEIEHELETSIRFYRDATYSDNGTVVPSFNRNDNSSNNATTLVYHTPTITDYGTSKGIIQQGAGKKAGGSDRESNEFILKQNSAYLIVITNLTVNDNLMAIKLNWYEHRNLE